MVTRDTTYFTTKCRIHSTKPRRNVETLCYLQNYTPKTNGIGPHSRPTRPRDLSTNPPLPRIFFFPSLFSSSSSRTPRATNATLIRFNYRPTDRPTDYARLRQRHPLKRLRLDAAAAAMVMLPHCCCAPSHEEVKVRTNECILTHIWDNTLFFWREAASRTRYTFRNSRNFVLYGGKRPEKRSASAMTIKKDRGQL